jgi:hypothetical protein
MSVADLRIQLTCDTSGIESFIRSALFTIWCIQHGKDYNRATARVVTAL